MNIKKSILLRVRIAFLLMGGVALAIVLKISHIQLVDGEKWRTRMEKRDIQFRHIKAHRGSVFAADGSLLATSLPFYRVAIDPTIASNKRFEEGVDSLSLLLSQVFTHKSAEQYKTLLTKARKNNRQYVILSNRYVDFQTKKAIEAFPILRAGKYRGGAIFEVENRRFAPFNSLASRTIGYINDEGEGVVGLEYSFEKHLGGRDGRALFQNIGNNTWRPRYDGSSVTPEDGLDIFTTIDVNVQDVAHTALLNALIKNDADFGCAVVMEVATGEIKAMANLGKIREGIYAENYNYAIGSRGSNDPGSIFKLASMMALLEEKKMQLTDRVETGNGRHRFFGTPLNDPKSGGFGNISVQQVFEKSSSIGVAKLVRKYFKDNPQKFIDYLNQFGLNTPLHFQLVGETTPYIKNVNDPTWSVISLPWISIGYETKISPLQMLTFYNAVANEGKMVQPILVKYIKEADKIVEEFNTVTLKEKICSDSTLRQVTRLLEGVVERGTARAIRTTQYRIAGKTSTSQKFIEGKYSKSYHTAFAGFFPADKPKYSCIVVIDNPKKEKQYGGDVAAPVFRKIADRLYANDLQMHPEGKVLTQLTSVKKIPKTIIGNVQDISTLTKSWQISTQQAATMGEGDWLRGKAQIDQSLTLKAIRVRKNRLPDVRNMTLKDALYLLENHGLKVVYKGQGKVLSQSIPPNRVFKRGRTVYLDLH